MALNFPNSPTLNQVYTDTTSGFSYQWNGTVWISFSAATSNQIRVLDDISGSFNNSTLTFALTSGSTSISPPNKQSLIINLGGVIQDPSDDYSVSGSNITFSTAPTNGLSFSGISLGPAIPVTLTTIPDGTVTSGSLTVAGILSTTNLFVTGISTFVGLATHTGTIFGNNLSLTGVATATEFDITGSSNTFNAGGLSVGVATATTFVGALTGNATGLSGSPNITVGNITGTAATFTNLTVNGTQTIINTTSLEITDKNIGIGSTSSPTDANADGAGITIYGTTNKTLTWDNSNSRMLFNSPVSAAGSITELYAGQYWNLVSQADVGIGASQVPLNQYLGQLAFVDDFSPTTLIAPRIQSVGEKTSIISGNTASLTYNTGGGNIAICTNPSGDITLAVAGIPTDSTFDNTSLTFSVFVNQTGTARSCTAVTLNGLSASIRWAGGSLSAAISGVTTTSGTDIFSFTGINTIGSAGTTANYRVLGVVNGGFR